MCLSTILSLQDEGRGKLLQKMYVELTQPYAIQRVNSWRGRKNRPLSISKNFRDQGLDTVKTSVRLLSKILAVAMFACSAFANDAYSQDVKNDRTSLGCIRIDTDLPQVNYDPWDSWQNWCDLDPSASEIECFDLIDGEWALREVFDGTVVIKRRTPGERSCPLVPDGTKPPIRGR